MTKPKVVIVGGGFGGINIAEKLKHANFDIVLIDKKNHHLFQPLLYQVATAALSPADIAVPLREIVRNHKNTQVIMGEVVDIDKGQRQITLGNGDVLSYDYLVLAVGASHSYFGKDEWAPLAPGLKTLTDALQIREKILISFEKAERMENSEEAAKYLNFVIIGAGPTGVEMAGAIAEIAHNTMFKNFRRIKPEKSKIYLIEGTARVLPPYPAELSYRAKSDLEKLGVKIITKTLVTKVTENGVYIGEDFIGAKNIIWAAGNQAAPILKKLEVQLDRQGRAVVNPDLSLPDFPEIFVIGDAAATKGKKGEFLPAVASVAIQQGRYLGNLLKKQLPKEKRSPFKYFDKGVMATIGKAKAVAYIGKIRLTGFIAWIAWLAIHVGYLIGFRNRFSVMLQWFFHYFTGIRGARIIHRSIDEELPKTQSRL